MLAINHATLATSAVFGYAIYFNQVFFLPLIVLVIFAAITPDVDHPNSELGRKFKFLSKILPHRGVTHSFLGVAIFGGIIYAGFGVNQFFTYALIVACILGAAFTEKLILENAQGLSALSQKFVSSNEIKLIVKISSFVVNVFLFFLIFLVWNNRLRIEILSLLLAGYLLHILGDFVTKEGVPLFWPIKQKFGLKLFRTGGKIETLIGLFLAVFNVYLIILFVQKFGVTNLNYWQNYIMG